MIIPNGNKIRILCRHRGYKARSRGAVTLCRFVRHCQYSIHVTRHRDFPQLLVLVMSSTVRRRVGMLGSVLHVTREPVRFGGRYGWVGTTVAFSLIDNHKRKDTLASTAKELRSVHKSFVPEAGDGLQVCIHATICGSECTPNRTSSPTESNS